MRKPPLWSHRRLFAYLACCVAWPCWGLNVVERHAHAHQKLLLTTDGSTVAVLQSNLKPALKSTLPLTVRTASAFDALLSDGAREAKNYGQSWGVLIAAMLSCFLLDGLILQRLPYSLRWDVFRIIVWLLAGSAYCFAVSYLQGEEQAVEWGSGYVLEWLLSLDNLFVILLVFKAYKTPEKLVPKALTCWIPCGMAIRLAMFALLETAYDKLGWLKVIGGIYVVYSAIVAACEDDDDMDVSELAIVKLCHCCLGSRLEDKYDEEGHGLFIWKDGGMKATLLVMVVVSLVVVDTLLAFDSVSAKVTQIPNKYIACSSTMMALFGMRAFVVFLEDLVHMFDMLKYGICAILAFVGVQLILSGLVPGLMELSPTDSMLVVLFFLSCSIIASSLRMCVPWSLRQVTGSL